MTWGQVAIWDVLQWLGPDTASLNQAAVRAVPAGRDLDDVRDAFRHLIQRHESLRTGFTESGGELRQHVDASVELDVPVYLAEDAEQSAELAERVAAELAGEPFDLASRRPLRCAVIAVGTVPAHVVLTVSHMAVDGGSMRILTADLETVLRGEYEALPPRARQPLERAAYESSAEGVAREERTLRHWRRTGQAGAAATMSALPAPADEDLDWAEIDSLAMGEATRVLAERSGAGPAVVVLGCIGRLLADLAGEQSPVIRSLTATRFNPLDQDYVGAFNQNALLRLPTEEDGVADYLRRASTAFLAGLRACEADPRRAEAMLGLAAQDRGFTAGSYCFFNDIATGRGAVAPEPGTPLPAPEDIEAARAHTVARPLPYAGRQIDSKFFVFLRSLTPTVSVRLCKDRRFLSETDTVGFLRTLERLMVDAAHASSWKEVRDAD